MKYLSTLKKIGKAPVQTFAQHIQIDNVTLRCHFCVFREDCKNLGSLLICSRQHGCDNVSSLFAQLVAEQATVIQDDDKFVPSAITKTITVDYIKRFLHLIYSRYNGFNCYRNCYYYPYVAGGQMSIFQCAASHGCGANSNWFTLLNLVENVNNLAIPCQTTDLGQYYITEIAFETYGGNTLVMFWGHLIDDSDVLIVPYKMINGTKYYLVGPSKSLVEWEAIQYSGGNPEVSFGQNHDLLWYLYFNGFNFINLFTWRPTQSFPNNIYCITADKVSHLVYTIRSKDVSESILDGDERVTLSGKAMCLYSENDEYFYVVAKTGTNKNRLLMTTDDNPTNCYWSEVILPSTTYFGKNVTVPLTNTNILTIQFLMLQGVSDELLLF